jgi:hypothetical protein
VGCFCSARFCREKKAAAENSNVVHETITLTCHHLVTCMYDFGPRGLDLQLYTAVPTTY